jgi:hypothetical protein
MKSDSSGDRYSTRKTSIKDRKSKVTIKDFSTVPDDFAWYAKLKRMIPAILRGRDLEELSRKVARARSESRPVILMMGAHVVKCGLSRWLCELVRRDVVTAIGVNGAFAIHDLEIAMWGKTSEDVGQGLKQGDFGMTEETARVFNEAAKTCLEETIGLGKALGSIMLKANPSNPDASILATAADRGVKLTVHVAIGTDIVHQHEEADGKAIGFGTMLDFRQFASAIRDLNGGVVINIGSAVVMPEVFLKALAIARNMDVDLGQFTTANFDMFSLYRPMTNLIERPRLLGASPYSFLGHHEILLPVFIASVLSQIEA